MTENPTAEASGTTRGLEVTGKYHRATIPKDARDRLGIDHGDQIMVKVTDPDYRTVTFFPPVDADGRFAVPDDVREYLGIESGDRVEFEVIA